MQVKPVKEETDHQLSFSFMQLEQAEVTRKKTRTAGGRGLDRHAHHEEEMHALHRPLLLQHDSHMI